MKVIYLLIGLKCVLACEVGDNHLYNEKTTHYTIQQRLYFQFCKCFTVFKRVYLYMKQRNAADGRRRFGSTNQQSPEFPHMAQ